MQDQALGTWIRTTSLGPGTTPLQGRVESQRDPVAKNDETPVSTADRGLFMELPEGCVAQPSDFKRELNGQIVTIPRL
jgi:hypothetical protein